MKTFFTVLLLVLIISCANTKNQVYTGSTPAAPVVRSFLGIPLTDSIDFIRWKITFINSQYILQCNYGIGKPNTNGFINGGKKIKLIGAFKKESSLIQLQYDNRMLSLAELNNNLLHILDSENKLLVGNSGWSYTLNNLAPIITDKVSLTAKQSNLKDSIAFVGRTPCGVPGIIAPGRECYKLKWYIVLYANVEKNEPGTYKVLGTAWRKEVGKRGTWKIITGKDNRIIYQLNDEKENGFIYFLKLDENIISFIDANGNLLVGDLDFSYALNRCW